MAMVILIIDLKSGIIEEKEWKESYNGLRCSLALYKEFGKDALVMSSIEAESFTEGSISPWHIVWYSEITKKMEFCAVNYPHGYSLYKMGISAIVIIGRAEKLKYITLSLSKREILPIENMREAESKSFEAIISPISEISISTGVAADKGVLFGTIQYRGKNFPGSGLGHAFYLHNLKAIVLPNYPIANQSSEGEKAPQKNPEKNRFFRMVKNYGEYSFIPYSLRLGWAPIKNYQKRFDPRLYSLDGRSMAEKFGNYPDGCMGCLISCSRRTKKGDSLPSWKDILLLGPNIVLFDPYNIYALYDRCILWGLDVATVGAIISYILYSSDEEKSKYNLDFSITSLTSFIDRLASGALLSKGLEDLPNAIQGFDHRPISYDLRGAFSEALLYSQGLEMTLPATLFFPKKRVDERCSSIFALYETIYTLALLSLGHPPFLSSIIYWSKVPEVAFHVPCVARFFCRHFNAFGHKSDELLVRGLEIYNALNLSWHSSPYYFSFCSESAFDSSTVPIKKLQDYYDEEKLHLLITVKSIKERMAKKDGVNKPKVGPLDERESATDPGLK